MKNKFLFLFLTCLILGGCAVSNHNMYCQSDKDCTDGFSCRSKKGGGTECRAKPDEHTMSCQSDIDCSAGFSCRSKTGGGTECRAKGFSNIQQPSTGAEQSTQTMPSPITVQPIEQPIQSKSAIEEAKETCASLGFKSKTEKFGNCVLKLTK
jgi:hypothetical protein